MKRHLLILLGAATMTAMADTAGAYSTHGYWSSSHATMRSAKVSFPAGSSWRSALNTVVSRYYNNPSNFWFSQQHGDTSVGFDNGQNEVWFSSNSSYSPAVTYWWYYWWAPNRLKEADIVFYNGVSYTTSMSKTSLWPFGGSYRPFQTTAMHEYGHAAGLSHEDGEYNIMGEDWTHIHCNGQTARSYVGEDACDGLVGIYGVYGGNFQDVSVTLWRYWYDGGEYSKHRKSKMFYTSGVVLPSTAYNGQRRYKVSKGQTVKVEFSYENNGASTQSVKIGFYLSTNSYISTADRFLGSGNITISRDNVATTANSYIWIPSDLISGETYYLGAIIDYNGAVSEVDEGNNRAYHVIRIN